MAETKTKKKTAAKPATKATAKKKAAPKKAAAKKTTSKPRTAAQLRAIVTSPGGTTAAGLRELERGGLRAAVDAAVQAAKTRSERLGITTE